MQSPTVGSEGGVVSYERGTPVRALPRRRAVVVKARTAPRAWSAQTPRLRRPASAAVDTWWPQRQGRHTASATMNTTALTGRRAVVVKARTAPRAFGAQTCGD